MRKKQEYMDTGYAPIDEEHRAISEQVRALLAAVNTGDVAQCRAILRVVSRNAASHFAHEERLMEQWRYPKADRHHEAHANFLKDAAQFGEELDQHGISPIFQRWALSRLTSWFQFHIIANDVELGMFLHEQAKRSTASTRPGPAPQR